MMRAVWLLVRACSKTSASPISPSLGSKMHVREEEEMRMGGAGRGKVRDWEGKIKKLIALVSTPGLPELRRSLIGPVSLQTYHTKRPLLAKVTE